MRSPLLDPLSPHWWRRLVDRAPTLNLARVLNDENVGRANCSAISTQIGCETLYARQDLCFSSVVSYVGTFVSTDLEGAIKSLGERGNDDVIERVNSPT